MDDRVLLAGNPGIKIISEDDEAWLISASDIIAKIADA